MLVYTRNRPSELKRDRYSSGVRTTLSSRCPVAGLSQVSPQSGGSYTQLSGFRMHNRASVRTSNHSPPVPAVFAHSARPLRPLTQFFCQPVDVSTANCKSALSSAKPLPPTQLVTSVLPVAFPSALQKRSSSFKYIDNAVATCQLMCTAAELSMPLAGSNGSTVVQPSLTTRSTIQKLPEPLPLFHLLCKAAP